MEEKLRAYMDSIFRDVKPNRKSIELKEEILQNLIDKYSDLITEGKTTEAAYNIAISGIGDIDEILDGMEKIEPTSNQPSKEDIEKLEKYRQKSAILTSVAVALYILSVVPLFLMDNYEGLDITLMFIMIAVATALLIYNEYTRPIYKKNDDTIVENFKEFNHQSDSNRLALKAVNSALWAMAVAVYILISFWTMAWHITWIVFLIAAAIEKIIKAAFELKGK